VVAAGGRRLWAVRATALLASVAATLVVCEVALRVAGPEWLRASMAMSAAGAAVLGETPNPFGFAEWANGMAVRFRPGAEFAVVDREYRNDVHITSWGTRVTGSDGAGPEAIVFAGDSFTFGLGVDDLDTFVSRSCRATHLACLNNGIPGASLPSELNALETNLISWGSPGRVVFVFFAGNDLPELLAMTEQTRRPAQPPPKTRAALQNLNRYVNDSPVLSRSYTLRLFKRTAMTWATPGSMDLMMVTAAGARGDFGRRARAALSASLDRLERLSKEDRFAASFLILPDRHQVFHQMMVDAARYYHLDPDTLDMQFPQRILEEELNRRGIPYQDVQSCLDPSDEQLYYRRDNHFTRRGHAAVAACIARAHDSPEGDLFGGQRRAR
jgi:hypothetical protein